MTNDSECKPNSFTDSFKATIKRFDSLSEGKKVDYHRTEDKFLRTEEKRQSKKYASN
jgi:hypothetical protein